MSKQPVASAQRRNPPQRNSQTRGTVTRRVRAAESPRVTWNLPVGKTNGLIFLGGLAVIIIGYFLMATAISDDPANNDGVWNNANSVTIAPILLTIGYCVIVPLALMYRRKQTEAAPTSEAGSEA